MYNAFSHSHSAFIYSYYCKEVKVTESSYTVQDAYMRSPAVAEDLKCHSSLLAVLPALQHLFQSSVLGSHFNKYLCRELELLISTSYDGRECRKPVIPLTKGGTQGYHPSMQEILCWRETALKSIYCVKY